MEFKSILFLAFALVSAKEATQLFEPCRVSDVKCSITATHSFIAQTYFGIPQAGILKIDPLVIEHIDIPADDNLGLAFHFHNATVTGLKDLRLLDFNMNLTTKTAVMKMQTRLSVVGDFEARLPKKTFSGLYSASATVYETTTYGFSLINKDGVEHFTVGATRHSCQIKENPSVALDEELQRTISSDPDAITLNSEWEKKKNDIRKKTICKLSDRAFVSVFENLRTAAKLFPKTHFFTDLE